MSHYSYHNRIKQRISNNELVNVTYKEHRFNDGKAPAMILHFDTEPKTRPIREYKFAEYQELLSKYIKL